MDRSRWGVVSTRVGRNVTHWSRRADWTAPLHLTKPGFPTFHLATTSLLPTQSPSQLLKYIIIVATQFSGRRSSIESGKKRLETDCGSDNEWFIAKFRLKLKNVWESTTQFRYELNQIYLLLPLQTLQLFEKYLPLPL